MSNDDKNETPQQSAEIQDDTDLEVGATTNIASERAVVEAPDPPSSGYIDEEESFILLPKPGLPDGASIYEFNTNTNVAANNNKTNQDNTELRKVPIECSICLCEYTVGSDTVWSSNPQCDHVFHANCIEQWLMKQRDGPLCPCCRRDFVIDPFDFRSGETNDLEKGVSVGSDSSTLADRILFAATTSNIITLQTPPTVVDDEDAEVVAAAAALEAALVNSMSRIDESDGSSSSDIAHQEAVADDTNNNSSNSNST